MDKEVDKTSNTDLDRRNISKENKTYIKRKMYLTDMRAVRALGQIIVSARKPFPQALAGPHVTRVCGNNFGRRTRN